MRGLIAILMDLLNGLPFSDVLGFDVRATLTALNLADNLGSQRTNGLLSMVERLKRAAI
ncbi:MAG: SufE family protein [Asticcacaulis sp.]